MEAEGSGQDRGEPPGSFNAQNVTGSPSVLRRAGNFFIINFKCRCCSSCKDIFTFNYRCSNIDIDIDIETDIDI